jgi:hypothetical protein
MRVRRRRSSSTSDKYEEEATASKCKEASANEQVQVCRDDDARGWHYSTSMLSQVQIQLV